MLCQLLGILSLYVLLPNILLLTYIVATHAVPLLLGTLLLSSLLPGGQRRCCSLLSVASVLMYHRRLSNQPAIRQDFVHSYTCYYLYWTSFHNTLSGFTSNNCSCSRTVKSGITGRWELFLNDKHINHIVTGVIANSCQFSNAIDQFRFGGCR